MVALRAMIGACSGSVSAAEGAWVAVREGLDVLEDAEKQPFFDLANRQDCMKFLLSVAVGMVARKSQ